MPLHLDTLTGPLPDPPGRVNSRGSEGASAASMLGKLTRRSFLAACVAGCSQAVLPRVPGARPERRGETWALVADPHVSRKLHRKFYASCMADNLRRAVDEIGELGPDQMLVNGDVGYMHGRAEDYAAFLHLTTPLRARGVPMHLTLGNHDRRDRFVQSLPVQHDGRVEEKVASCRQINAHRWIFLDSLEEGRSVRGSLGGAQLAWLRERLDAEPGVPTIICLHHNPHLSAVGLTDHEAFREIVVPRRQVKLVLCGHTHIFRTWETQGLHFVNQPALGFRLAAGTSLGWMGANIEADRARLVFRGVSRKEKDDGWEMVVRWRSA